MRQQEILHEQEKKVMNMLCTHSPQEIAENLNISLHSVKSYLIKFERLELWNELKNLISKYPKQN